MNQVEYYQVNPTLTFILTSEKIIVRNKYQSFLVTYEHGNYRRQWNTLADMIRSRNIHTMTDLVDFCYSRADNGHQLQGLIMIPTDLKRHGLNNPIIW